MFAKLTLAQRIQVGLVLVMAFLLVLGSNRLDKRHFATVQTTVNSVFKDRVVAQDYIHQLSSIFHAKELRFILDKDKAQASDENKKIYNLLEEFENTELTTEESKLLKKLNFKFQNLLELENRRSSAESDIIHPDYKLVAAVFTDIKEGLNGLAQIQLEQSEELTQLSNKSLGVNILLSKLEVLFLAVVAVVMLVLVFYSKGASIK